MAEPITDYEGPSIGPAPVLTEEEKKKRRQAALNLYKEAIEISKKEKSLPPSSSMFFSPEDLEKDVELKPVYPKVGSNYLPLEDQTTYEKTSAVKKGLEKINEEEYGFNPDWGKYSKDSQGKSKVEPQSNIFKEFTGGVLRPFEKMVRGNKAPSVIPSYNLPDEAKTSSQKLAGQAGELTGYGLEYAPFMKGVKAIGAGERIAGKLISKQVGKTAAGELTQEGGKSFIKNRLRSYAGKKVLGNMVDDGIAGALQMGAESRGDPLQTAMGATFGAIGAPVNKYALQPIFKGLSNAFKNNLYNQVKQGTENLSEAGVKKAIQDPKAITQTMVSAADDTLQSVKNPDIKDVKKLNTQELDLSPSKIKERGFITTIKESPQTVPEVAKQVKGEYTPITNKATLEAASKAIQENEDDVLTEILGPKKATADQVAKAQLLIDKYSREGKHEQAIQIVEKIAPKLTEQGQSIQAASMWNRLTPAGILKTAQRTFQQANELNPNANLKLTNELSEKLTGMAEKIKTMPEGEEKTRATLLMLKEIQNKVPTSLGKKIDTVQTIGQLLNPKTAIRNVVGNAIFGGVENAQQTLASGLDKAVSLITGKRSVLAPNPIEQIKGGIYGAKQGFKDAIQGIDTSGTGTQFDLPTGETFKSKWNPMRLAEKTLNISLRTPDRAFTEAYKKDYMRMAQKLAKINKETFDPAKAMEEANILAKYRTYQDDTAFSKAFSDLKKALNYGVTRTKDGSFKVEPKEFGLGSFVLKYPKTPANLLARSIDYSPVSFLRSVNELGRTWFKGQAFNQRKFVTDLSKGITGTGIIGMGYYLADLGLLSGAPNKDKDISTLERQEGGGKYRLNVTGLKRFLETFNPSEAKTREGDKIVSYDWAQPISTSFAIGANMSQGSNQPGLDKVSKITEALKGGVDSLYEQPLLTGIAQVFKGDSAPAAAEKVGQGMLSSFVPTIVSQINQYQDNAQRDPYDPNFFKYATNLAKSKIPGLAQQLPQSYDVWGKPLERFKNGGNSFFNVFLNPAFTATYKPTPESQFVIDLYTNTGETKHAPKVQDKKVRAYGFEIEPSASVLQSMQQYAGQRTREMYRAFMSNPKFMNLPDVEKANMLSSELSKIGADTKLKFLGNDFVQQAEKSGDRQKYYQVKQDMVQHLETEQAKDLYDQITVMKPEERKQYLTKLYEEYPELLEKVGTLKIEDTYEKLMGLSTEDRMKMLQGMPDEMVKRVTKIRKEELKKYSTKEFGGLNSRFAAEYLTEILSKMPQEEQGPYLKNLYDKGILKTKKNGEPTGIFKELVKIKEGKQSKAEKYLVPYNQYFVPAQ